MMDPYPGYDPILASLDDDHRKVNAHEARVVRLNLKQPQVAKDTGGAGDILDTRIGLLRTQLEATKGVVIGHQNAIKDNQRKLESIINELSKHTDMLNSNQFLVDKLQEEIDSLVVIRNKVSS